MVDFILFKNHKIAAKTAISQKDHATGLMFKTSPEPMIFPYNFAAVRKFWMKNTVSPLDIVFCSKNKIVSIEKGIPFSLNHVGPNIPTDLVIEFQQGSCNKIGMVVGDLLQIKYSLQTIADRFEYALSKMT